MDEKQKSQMQKSPEESKGKSPLQVRYRVLIAAAIFMVAVTLFLVFRKKADPFTFNMIACLLCAGFVLTRYFLGAKNRWERGVFAVVLAVLFFGVIFNNHYRYTKMLYQRGWVRTWNIYHYYLGSKYFNELGYKDLYTQTMVADREGKGRLDDINRIRDMEDYRTKSPDKVVPEFRNPAFTDARWKSFKKDLNVLLKKERSQAWQKILSDRGYNPTPFWNSVGHVVSSSLDISQKGQLLFLASTDFILYALMIGAVIWAFGFEASMLMFLCFLLLPFNIARLVAGYMQYDWTCGIVLGVCFLKKNRPVGSAIGFGYAIMARVFPLFMVMGLGAPALRGLLRDKKIDRFYWKFAAAFTAFILFGFAFGSMSAKGYHAWLEWKSNIKLHNYEMTYGQGRVGLKHIFTHKLGESKHFEGENARKRIFQKQKSIYYASAIMLFILFVAALWYRNNLNAALLSMVLIYIILVPSHYYWSILAVMPLWQKDESDDGAPWAPALIPALTAFIVPATWYQFALHQKDQLAQYIRFDWVLLICLLALMVQMIVLNVLRYKKTGSLLK